MLSSQEAEAQLDDEPDLQTQVVNLRDQIDVFARQVASNMQERIQYTATLVVGRLVRAASTRQDEESDKNALTNYVSTPLRKCRIGSIQQVPSSHQKPLQKSLMGCTVTDVVSRASLLLLSL